VRNTEIMAGGRKEAALMIKPNLKGLNPGRYAFHVHENPECGSAQKDGQAVAGMAAGGHLWLAGTGSLKGQVFGSHLGDLPDMVADADGTATQEVVVARLSLADVVNRAVMLHASEDDTSPRMACGVIR
ncbi:MAG: superoxide dismutase family protein, partial [Pseudomonadota bacterium]